MRRALLGCAASLALLAASGALAQEHAAPAGEGGGVPAHSEPAVPAEPAPTRPPMPFDVMRSVQFLQDQVAHGNARAIRVQALLLRRFARSFLEADPAVWADARNQRAAVLFSLSGGPPDLVEALRRENLLGALPPALVEGAALYGRNRLDEARERFAALDLDALEPALAAQVALARGQVRQIGDPAAAASDLDRARLLAPGTLIEEAALRLGALLVDETGDHAKADRLARRYFEAFGDSAYAANFEARFVAMSTARGRADPDGALRTLADAAAPLAAERRRRLLLAVARRSLVEGDLRFAGRVAAEAEALPGGSAGDRERAAFYVSAASVAELDPAEGERRLGAVRRDALHPEDGKLLDAALAVLASIRRGVEPPPAAAEVAAAEPAAPAPAREAGPDILARAEQALAGAAQDLAR